MHEGSLAQTLPAIVMGASCNDRAMAKKHASLDLGSLLRVSSQTVLAKIDPQSTPGAPSRAATEQSLVTDQSKLRVLQERLYAQARGGSPQSLLLVIQGMDTSGKGGIMRHVVGGIDPQGVHLTSFKAPTPEEREHDFLWRIRKALPSPGIIGVFDRSHYEDVLIVRVHNLVPESQWTGRYDQINDFEQEIQKAGTKIIKIMLHISSAEQKERLGERLARPDKYWKYNPQDVTERGFWSDYQAAYQQVLTQCSPESAPWYVVPANRKWYTRWAVQRLLLEHLTQLDPQWPPASFDVAAEQERLAASQ